MSTGCAPRKPAARRDGVQCWHGGPHNAVHEYVGAVQRAAPAWRSSAQSSGSSATPTSRPRGADAARRARVKIRLGVPLDLAGGKWLLNPGAVGAPVPPRRGWWDALDSQAADGAFWLLLDLDARTRDLAARAVRPRPGPRARARSGSTTTRATQGERPAARCGSRLARTAAGHKRPLSPWRAPSTAAAAVPASGKVPD